MFRNKNKLIFLTDRSYNFSFLTRGETFYLGNPLLTSQEELWWIGLINKVINKLIPEASSCKYLGIILRSDLSWEDRVNYTVKKAWKALQFTVQILKKGNSNTKSLAYMSLVRPILEYGAACGIRTGRDK